MLEVKDNIQAWMKPINQSIINAIRFLLTSTALEGSFAHAIMTLNGVKIWLLSAAKLEIFVYGGLNYRIDISVKKNPSCTHVYEKNKIIFLI